MIIDLNIRGKDVIVIGGGTEGSRKVQALLGQGCNIIVISENFDEYLEKLARENKIKIIKTSIKDVNILDEYKPYMVLATTDNKELNRAIVKKAKELGALAYAADDPEISDFIHPAIINIKDTLFIAISTKGASPLMAKLLRIKIEDAIKDIIKDEDLMMIELTNFARTKAMKVLNDIEKRKMYLYTIVSDEKINELIKNNMLEEAKNEALNILERWANE